MKNLFKSCFKKAGIGVLSALLMASSSVFLGGVKAIKGTFSVRNIFPDFEEMESITFTEERGGEHILAHFSFTPEVPIVDNQTVNVLVASILYQQFEELFSKYGKEHIEDFFSEFFKKCKELDLKFKSEKAVNMCFLASGYKQIMEFFKIYPFYEFPKGYALLDEVWSSAITTSASPVREPAASSAVSSHEYVPMASVIK